MKKIGLELLTEREDREMSGGKPTALLHTKACVICGEFDVRSCSGHVIAKVYTGRRQLLEMSILACKCEEHSQTCGAVGGNTGCYGEWDEWMGITDHPWKKWCRVCNDVGRLDCCGELDCPDCEGLFSKNCPGCDPQPQRTIFEPVGG